MTIDVDISVDSIVELNFLLVRYELLSACYTYTHCSVMRYYLLVTLTRIAHFYIIVNL